MCRNPHGPVGAGSPASLLSGVRFHVLLGWELEKRFLRRH